jgi:hypothetical protein
MWSMCHKISCCKHIHFNLFVKENQVVISEILLDMITAGNIKITNIFRY